MPYSQAYSEVSVIVRLRFPLTVTSSGAWIPPPPGASGMLYRSVSGPGDQWPRMSGGL